MDRKLINEYGTDILCYRLRTARQKTRMQYEDFDKHLRKLHKEKGKLKHMFWELGWKPLIPPFQRGWNRFFVLREDVARSEDAAFFENLLKKINTTKWSHRRDFMVRTRNKAGRKVYIQQPQQLQDFGPWSFDRFDFSEKERRYFDLTYVFYRGNELRPVYVFNEPWRFVLRVRPNIVDKFKVMDGELQSRMKEINSYIDLNGYYARYVKVIWGKGSSYWKPDWPDERQRSPLRNKPIIRILDELYHPDTIHT